MKLYKKIDLFFNGDYLFSTEQAKTCREARQRYLDSCSNMTNLVSTRINKHPELLKARFDKRLR